MNAVATIDRPLEAILPAEMQFDDWVEEARRIFAEHRNAEWRVAEWLRVGIERFHDQPEMDLFLDHIGMDKKRAISDAKVARLIPPSWRSDRVSFEVCKQISKIEDEPTRQRFLKQAVDEHWNERAAHHAVVEHKSETGQLLPDDDATTRLSTEIVRCWNRARPDAREYFFALAEMAAASGFGPIDEDAAI